MSSDELDDIVSKADAIAEDHPDLQQRDAGLLEIFQVAIGWADNHPVMSQLLHGQLPISPFDEAVNKVSEIIKGVDESIKGVEERILARMADLNEQLFLSQGAISTAGDMIKAAEVRTAEMIEVSESRLSDRIAEMHQFPKLSQDEQIAQSPRRLIVAAITGSVATAIIVLGTFYALNAGSLSWLPGEFVSRSSEAASERCCRLSSWPTAIS